MRRYLGHSRTSGIVPGRPNLLRLAHRLGIVLEYIDKSGTTRCTSAATIERLIHAMGFEAATESSAGAALTALDAPAPLECDPVVYESELEQGRIRIRLLQRARAEWKVVMRTEDGDERCLAAGTAVGSSTRTLRLPPSLPLGYHQILLSCCTAQGTSAVQRRLAVCPATCYSVEEKCGRTPRFGIASHLYSVRGSADWGAGSFADLRALATWAGSRGADFIAINPIHAVRNIAREVSPYGPLSRVFRNAIYLDLPAVPEFLESRAIRQCLSSRSHLVKWKEFQRARFIDYEGVQAWRAPIVRELYREFARRHQRQDTARGRAYRSYVSARGEVLIRFATFTVLDRVMRERGHSADWRSWPARYRAPNTPAVARFAAEHQEEIDEQCFVQFELDRQLHDAARSSTRAGMAVGLFNDLALANVPNSADHWVFPALAAHSATIGAPPDSFVNEGQNFQLLPLNPRALTQQGYRYWTEVLQTSCEHAGALRIDHVMGLVRQYWIPEGAAAVDGAYVTYPAHDLFGILALESRRRSVVIVGEDLGTFPPGFRDQLSRRHILSTQTLFKHDDAPGRFRLSPAFSEGALASVNTHDFPPLAAYYHGDDLELLRQAGRLANDDALVAARAARGNELEKVRAIVQPSHPAWTSYTDFRNRVFRVLRDCPARLVAIWLDDLVGETCPVNIPGVSSARFPKWRRRLRMTLGEIFESGEILAAIVALRRHSGPSRVRLSGRGRDKLSRSSLPRRPSRSE
jgi:4-alpha-glucanotransferase